MNQTGFLLGHVYVLHYNAVQYTLFVILLMMSSVQLESSNRICISYVVD